MCQKYKYYSSVSYFTAVKAHPKNKVYNYKMVVIKQKNSGPGLQFLFSKYKIKQINGHLYKETKTNAYIFFYTKCHSRVS